MTQIDRRSLILGMIGAAGLTAAGCTSSSPDPAPTSAAPSSLPPSTTTTSATPSVDPRPRWPLTGVLMEDPAAGRHTPVAVKVPDNKGEHPQSGLDAADIVFVELEGYVDAAGNSSTRLMPVFHSHLPHAAAPVRSMRPVDVPLLAPIGVTIGSTGAAPWVVDYIKSFGQYVDGSLTYLASQGTGSYTIDRSRVRSIGGVTYYDRAVVCRPDVLAKRAHSFTSGPTRPYLPFTGDPTAVSTVTGRPAKKIAVPWKPGESYDMSYSYDAPSGRYLRSMPWGPHVLANGKRVSTDNVLVIRAGQRFAKLYPGVGHEEPVHDIIKASGTFVYAHGGAHVTGTWSKGSVESLFELVLDDGSPLLMAPGQTYVELPRLDAKIRIS